MEPTGATPGRGARATCMDTHTPTGRTPHTHTHIYTYVKTSQVIVIRYFLVSVTLRCMPDIPDVPSLWDVGHTRVVFVIIKDWVERRAGNESKQSQTGISSKEHKLVIMNLNRARQVTDPLSPKETNHHSGYYKKTQLFNFINIDEFFFFSNIFFVIFQFFINK